MDKVLMVIGFGLVAWFLTGFLMMTFLVKIYVVKGVPLSAKIGAMIGASMVAPRWIWGNGGRVPMMVVAPEQPSPEEEAGIQAFLRSNCQCRACKARRGEG